jgi:hypothetical protein
MTPSQGELTPEIPHISHGTQSMERGASDQLRPDTTALRGSSRLLEAIRFDSTHSGCIWSLLISLDLARSGLI